MQVRVGYDTFLDFHNMEAIQLLPKKNLVVFTTINGTEYQTTIDGNFLEEIMKDPEMDMASLAHSLETYTKEVISGNRSFPPDTYKKDRRTKSKRVT